MENKEIEIKIPLTKNEFISIKKKIQEIAEIKDKTQEKDEYFNPPHRDFLKPKFPFEWLRISKRGEKASLNYKHYYPENVEDSLYCDEFESEIESSESLRKVLLSLNFKPLIVVEKKRETYICQNEFKITLDEVKELGNFIEIESLRNPNIKVTRNKLFGFAKKLGLDIAKRDKRGYPYLMLKKKGLV